MKEADARREESMRLLLELEARVLEQNRQVDDRRIALEAAKDAAAATSTRVDASRIDIARDDARRQVLNLCRRP